MTQRQHQRWQFMTSGVISLLILLLAIINREWLLAALSLIGTANPFWLFVALVIICVSYLISSQVFQVVLRTQGYRMSIGRTWAIALIAIIVSQSVPAGGVGSYAFLVRTFNRHGVPPAKSTLVASLEMISYTTAMLLIFVFSLIYLAGHRLVVTIRWLQFVELGLEVTLALVVIGGIVFVVTRREETLTHWVLPPYHFVARLLRQQWDGTWPRQFVSEFVRGRMEVARRWPDVALLVFFQLVALSGHSLAMLVILHSLGVTTNFAVVLTAFGIALITSTFNILPGGGGTVEAMLVAVLSLLGVGAAAVAATIVFRLMNFWLLMPVAAACYHWLIHAPIVIHEVPLKP